MGLRVRVERMPGGVRRWQRRKHIVLTWSRIVGGYGRRRRYGFRVRRRRGFGEVLGLMVRSGVCAWSGKMPAWVLGQVWIEMQPTVIYVCMLCGKCVVLGWRRYAKCRDVVSGSVAMVERGGKGGIRRRGAGEIVG